MGKSLLELINDKQALADLASKQAGNQPQPNTGAQQSSLLGVANTTIQNLTGINTKDLLVKYVGQEPIDKLRVEANFIEKFPGIALKEYGLDAPRIILQRDPHANKKLAQKAVGAVASAVGVIPLVGKRLKTGINKLADAALKPLYPDDWLQNPDSGNPTFEGYYHEIYTHTINNSHGLIGNYLQGTRTVSQAKDNLLSSGLSLGVGAGMDFIQGAVKKFGGRTTKEGKTLGPDINNNHTNTSEYEIWRPFFPSQYAANSTTLDDNDLVMQLGYQQLRSDDFLSIGKKMYKKGTKSQIIKDSTDDAKKLTLESVYNKQFNEFLTYSKKYFNQRPIAISRKSTAIASTDDEIRWGKSKDYLKISNTNVNLPIKYLPRGYTSNLALLNKEDKTTDGIVGIYSVDSLRYWDDKLKQYVKSVVPEHQNDTTYELASKNSLHLDYFTNNISSNGGEGAVNDYGKFAEPTSTLSKGSYYSTYRDTRGILPGIGDIKPVRWNTNNAPYSTAYTIDGDATSGNNILDQDYYFVENSKQSQKNVNKNINPYWHSKQEVLHNNTNSDLVFIMIGKQTLLGTISGLSDNTTPTWSDVKPVGSGFKFYIYDSWEREITFKIRMYAESEKDLAKIWEKANIIKSYTLPTAKGILGVFGQTIPLYIGNLLNIPYGFLTQCNVTVLDESPWEITDGLQKPFIFDMDITYKVITNDDNYVHYQTQTGGIQAYTYNSTPGIDLSRFTPPNVGGPIPIDDIPVDPNANLTNTNLSGFSPLTGANGNPLGDRLKEMDNAQNFNTSGTGVTGTPVITEKPPNGTFTEIDLTGSPEAKADSLKMFDEVKAKQAKFIKEADYAERVPPSAPENTMAEMRAKGPSGIMNSWKNTYGEKPGWWKFREMKKYNNSWVLDSKASFGK